jgi:hypothetical protein
MDRDHLYVTLFSNASHDIYPDNKIAAFMTQLAQPIRQNPSEIWEVGLCELSYTASHGLQQNPKLLHNLNVFLNALIYCDLIAPQLIRTTKVRCLRSFRLVPTDYDSEYLFQNISYAVFSAGYGGRATCTVEQCQFPRTQSVAHRRKDHDRNGR